MSYIAYRPLLALGQVYQCLGRHLSRSAGVNAGLLVVIIQSLLFCPTFQIHPLETCLKH